MSVGIDLGRTTLKVVELQWGLSKLRVVGMGRKRISHLRGSEYAHVAPGLLQGVMGGRLDGIRATVGMTGRDINLQMRVFPASGLTNYPQMMGNEVKNQRTESPDLYIDWTTLRRPDSYFPRYISVIGMGKNSFIDERLGVTRSAGIRPTDAVPTPFALFAAYSHAYGNEGGVVMLLNVGADSIDMVLVRGGRMMFARNISQGASVFDEQIRSAGIKSPEEAEFYKIKFGSLSANGGDPRTDEIRPAIRQGAWQLVGVLKSSLNYAKTQLDESDLMVDKIYIAGGGAKIPGLGPYLKSALGAPVESLDPFRKMDASLIEAAGEEEALQLPTDMAVAAGLALIGMDGARYTHVSLLPDKIREKRKTRRSVPYLIGAVTALVVTLGIMTSLYLTEEKAELAKAGSIQKEITRLRKLDETLTRGEAGYRKLYGRADALESVGVTGRGILETYGRLRRIIRDGLIIEKMELKEPRQVRRAILNVPESGHVAGELLEEMEGEVNLKGIGRVRKGPMYAWSAVVQRLWIYGEVDENVKGGPHALLMDMERKLTDDSNGISAKLHWQGPSAKRPGWRAFEMTVEFE